MASILQNIQPAYTPFNIHSTSSYAAPSSFAPNVNWQKQPGYFPPIPARAVPAPPSVNLKGSIGLLPSIFQLNIGNGNNS